MVNTYEEIDKKIKAFCDNSAVVNEFNDDKFTGEFQSANHNYPLIWAVPTKMNISNGVVTFNVQITIADTMYEKSDLTKTLSDLAITLTELLTWIDDDSDNFHYFTTISADFLPFSQDIDNTSGWQGEIQFKAKFEADTADIRFK